MLRRIFWLVALLLVVAGLFGAIWLQRRSGGTDDDLFIPKETRITPEIELLRRYVRIDTSNPPGNESAGARFLLQHLRENGASAELIESAPGRGSVYARIRGRRPGEGLLLLHHIDVVPAKPEGWKSPPFAAETSLNMLWGRGALDMKSVGICHLEAFLSLSRKKQLPERDVVFLATADEEAGGEFGVAWLLEHRPDVFEGIRYALNEGGVTETAAEKITYFGVEIGSKQYVYLRMRSTERSALERARIALEPRFEPTEPDRVLPEVRAYLAAVAPHRQEHRHLLADVGKAIEKGQFWFLPFNYRALTQNNLWAKGIESDAAGLYIDVILQNLPDEDPQVRIAEFRRAVDSYGVTVEITRSMGPTRISSTATPFFEEIRKAVVEEYGPADVGPLILPFATTDSRYLRPLGITCYGLWPFPVDVHQTMGIHSVNERVRLDWFMKGVSFTRRLVDRYASGT